MFDCSIIVPVYFNEGSLEKFYKTIQFDVIEKNKQYSFQTIFIDDGSGDDSFTTLMFIKDTYKQANIKVIKLTRNFGQANAAFAGLNNADGKCFVYISADNQDPPELINRMLNFHFNEHFEIVIGTRSVRDESFFRKLTSRIFYAIIKIFIFSNMPKGGFDFVLHGLKVKEYIIKNFNAAPFTQGMMLWSGYKFKQLPYIRKSRDSGISKWSFSKKLKYLIDGIIAYSFFPVRFISICGIISISIALVYSVIVLLSKFLYGVSINTWSPLIILILALSGIQMLMLGILGEYLWRTFDQVRYKQSYLIENIYG